MAAIFVRDVVVSEGDDFVDIVVELTEASLGPVSVTAQTAAGTASSTSASDFTSKSEVLNFAAGETTKTVRVFLTDNATVESFEYFVLNLSAASGATIADTSAMISIVDNDTLAVTPRLFVRDVTVDEKAGTASFVVMLGGPAGEASASTVTVDYATVDGAAVAGSDYGAVSGTLTFAAGETVKTVVVNITDDADVEGIERFFLDLSNASNATIVDGQGVATISANDATAVAVPRISVADVVVSEADGYVDVVVSLSAPSIQAVAVNYVTDAITASYTSNVDFSYAAGTLNFAIGETTKVVRVAISNFDIAAENFEHFLFILSAPVNATLADAKAMVSIVDDDTVSVSPRLFVRDVTVDEKAGTASFVVMLGGPSGEASTGTVTVDYTTTDGTATAGNDYEAASGTLVFAAGETVKTVVVDISDDAGPEGIERFFLDLSNASNATIVDGQGVATISANDATAVAVPRISVADVVVSEADGYVDVVVNLSAPSAQAVTVNYATDAITATYTSNADFSLASGTLIFGAGETTKVVRVALSDFNTSVENFEHFLFILSSPVNATIADASAMISIVDDDTVSVSPRLFVRDVTVDEKAGTASFVVMLGGPSGEASTGTVTVDYTTADGTATAGNDYEAASGTLVFAAGETVKTVVVDITDDATLEGAERFTLNLGNATNATIVEGQGVATIAANDAATVALPGISVADVVVSEADGYVDVVVNLGAPSAQAVTVNYATDAITATYTSNADFSYASGTLIFGAGETTKVVRVALSDFNTSVENFEHFLFILSSPVNATIADASAMISIVDDDTVSVSPRLFVRDVVVDEEAGTATFVVMLGGPAGEVGVDPITVDYVTADNTATANSTPTAGSDYDTANGTLVFAPGETVKTVVVDIRDDATAEGIERFDFNLINASGNAVIVDGHGVAVIGASDAPAVASPGISVADIVVSEADGFVDVVVSLAAPGTQAVSVVYQTLASTATYTSNADFSYLTGTLNFAPGETTKTVRVAISNFDTTAEGLESFLFNLSAPVNATLTDASATISIVDNDNPGVAVYSFGISDDVYTVSAANDVIVENVGGGLDLVLSSVSYILGDNVDDMTLTGNAAINGTGNVLANVLIGNGAGNRLQGLAGNDTLDGGAGAATLEGGTGDDTYIVDQAGDTLTELIGAGTDRVLSSVSHTLANHIDNLQLTGIGVINGRGNTLANRLEGNSAANILAGDAGDDSLIGGGDGDTLVGGTGSDTYYIDSLADTIEETDATTTGGTDRIVASVTFTLGGNVELLTLTGNAAIDGTGNGLANFLLGNAGDNALFGEDGSDTLDGGLGANAMQGGNGDDTYYVRAATDIVTELGTAPLAVGIDGEVDPNDAGSNVDTVIASIDYTLTTNVEHMNLAGSANLNGNGNGLGNRLTGNAGANVLDGAAGADTLAGGAGNDTYQVDNASDLITETATAGSGTDVVNASVGYTLSANVETLVLTGGAAIAGTGNAQNNSLSGNNAANVLNGAAGADRMSGGGGGDTYFVDNAADVVIETSSPGTDLINSTVSRSLGLNQENLTLGGAAAINGTGNTQNNRLTGNNAANVLNGGAGSDTLTGGAGNDTYIVDVAGDLVVEAAVGGIDQLNSSVSRTLGTGQERLLLTGALAINGTGNTLDNTLTGNAARNLLSGLAGNDVLNGMGGADTLNGSTGNDTYYVDNLGDVVIESGDLVNGGIDQVYSSVTRTLGAYLERLTLTGNGPINATGNGLANMLTGNGAANIIAGGAGRDVLRGAAGVDTFLFDTALSAATNLDTISDFVHLTDRIALDDDVFRAFAGRTTITAGELRAGAGFTTAGDADDRLIYNTTTGALYYDADGLGGAAAVQFALLTTHPALSTADFRIVG